jgi:4-amino-4-deoxy-L-arabinose transferase-like glycosyltransferase
MKKQKQQRTIPFFENRRRLLAIVLGISIGLRIIILHQWNASVFSVAVWSDSATYNQWARSIITSGDWIGTNPFLMTPLYPYLLAVIYTITGESLTAVRLIQNAIGIGTILLIFLSADKMFQRRAAFFAAMAAALYGPFYLHANLLLVETVKVFLLILSLYLLLIATEKKNIRWWIYSGLVLGAAMLCRPTDIFVVGIALLWIFLLMVQPFSLRLRSASALFAAVILIVLPVTIRNYSVSKEFIPITSNGGLNFYLGNNPKAVGVYYNVDGLDLANDPDGRIFLETTKGKNFTAGQASAYWMNEAVDYIVKQPADFIVLAGMKALLFFHYKEIGQLGYNYHFISRNAVSALGYLLTFAVILPFSVVGIVVLRKEWKKYFLLYGLLAAQFLSVILFFVTDRFRLSSMPFLILFAGFGLDWLLVQWKFQRRKVIMVGGGSLMLAMSLSTFLNVRIDDEFSTEHEYIGMNYFDMKLYEKALFEYRQALRYNDSFHIHNNIGNVYSATGNIPAAMKEYQRGSEINPRQAISVFSMGTAYVRVQQFDSALTCFAKVKHLNPRFAPAYLNAGLSYWYTGNYGKALTELEIYLAMEPDRVKTASVRQDVENLKQIIAGEKR